MSLKHVLRSLAIVSKILSTNAQDITAKTTPQIKEVLQNNTIFTITSELPNTHKTLHNTQVYSSPDTNSNPIIQLPKNIFISVVVSPKAPKGWKSIMCGDQQGWIQSSALEKTNTLKMDLKTGTNKAIVVDKQHRKIKVYSNFGQKLEKEFDIGLGYGADSLDKTEEADGKTPEGVYYVAAKNASSMFGVDPKGKSLGSLMVSYPNEQDALEGYTKGLINKEQYNTIVKQIENHDIPDQKTTLGSYIMFHGGGTYVMFDGQKMPDRSYGCITLNNDDQKWLYNFMDEKSTIVIF